MVKSIDTSVAVEDMDMDLIKEIAEHEGISKKAVVHLAVSRYYGIWVSE